MNIAYSKFYIDEFFSCKNVCRQFLYEQSQAFRRGGIRQASQVFLRQSGSEWIDRDNSSDIQRIGIVGFKYLILRLKYLELIAQFNLTIQNNVLTFLEIIF
jgi:hypothetical protein